MKRFFKTLAAVVICLVLVVGFAVGAFFIFYTPSLTADMSVKTGDVTTGASGYLYGLAEEGVPSENMTESVDISTVSQKVPNGLQHPTGDLDHVSSQLENTDYNVVYLQDNYSTWYYENDSINESRAEGTYDWKEFLYNDYLPKVEESVNYLSTVSYSDKVVYCLYNECDNGVWFGETVMNDDGTAYGSYTEQGEQNFFEAWKITYDYVKSINSDALIGGPGFYEYESGKIERFLSYCVENDCVPDIMIYHELSDYSILFWQSHVEEYRNIENTLGIDELPIIVTEYGRMCDNGLPGKMLQYITQIETTKVYADNAFWRLSNNLCDVSADDNSPNSNWWLYRWYTDMEGQTVESSYQDLFMSNFENAFIKRKAEYTSWGFMGIVSINDDESQIDVICGGRDGSAVVKLKNIDETALAGQEVTVKIEEVVYKGLSGVVDSPVVLKQYTTTLNGSKLTIDMNDMDEANAYHITVSLADENDSDYENESYIERYEFEDGTLLGNAYTYDSAYASTGEDAGTVGGMENEGDGVTLTFSVPEDGTYNLDVIYGNSNDGEYDEESGKQNPDDRTDSVSLFSLDGENESELTFANTIKSEYTDCMTLTYELEAGEHTVTFKHCTGTIVLDSLVISTADEDNSLACLKDADRTTDTVKSYLVVAPSDGYYNVSISDDSISTAYVNNREFEAADENVVYLMRGLNYIDIESADEIEAFGVTEIEEDSDYSADSIVLLASDAVVSNGASISANEYLNIDYIDGISTEGGKAQFTINAETAGTYAVTLKYANNDEGGVHDYNVDLIERYITVGVNGESQNIYCRSTYSWDTYKTVTCYVTLTQGENVIELSHEDNDLNSSNSSAPYISSVSVSKISL